MVKQDELKLVFKNNRFGKDILTYKKEKKKVLFEPLNKLSK
jgi:hypothetical protein